MSEFDGQKVTIVGLGRTALPLAQLLHRAGARPFVTEQGNNEKIAERAANLDELGVPYELGGHTASAFEGAAAVIPSPGVSPRVPEIENAVVGGARLLSELEFAAQYCSSNIIAVTGTNGKTTTTELIHAMLHACGLTVTLAGNNAVPLSQAVLQVPQSEYIVLELSSYQLELTRTFRPWIGAVLNVRPDHMERHGTIENYAAAKGRMFANQTSDDHAVYNYDDPLCRRHAEKGPQKQWPFSIAQRLNSGVWLDGETIRHGDAAIASVADIQIPGRHNVENALAALAVARAGGFQWDRVLDGLRGFGGVEHRIEFVENLDGIRFYNDSKSTNLDSLRVALESFDEPIALIMGGKGKGEDYETIADLIEHKVKGLVLIGEEARTIRKVMRRRVDTCLTAADMNDAVLRATASVNSPGIVLFSPGCPSFDWYNNFEERGADFKEKVRELARVRRLAVETLERR